MNDMEYWEYVGLFLSDFMKILTEMAPFLLLGFFFAGLLHAFVPKNRIQRYLNGKPFASSLLASLFGIPLPLCSCGVIPTGAALYKNGASKGGTVSFMISTPQTGVDSILATFSLLGLPFAIIRPIAALITGVTGGLITSVATRNEMQEEEDAYEEEEGRSLSQKLRDVFRYGFVDFIQDISKWLVIGLLMAALISALIPDDFFNLLQLSPIIQMLAILLLSIPLYVCATGTIPLAAVLILKGISPGAAFVLLMAGPATNVATITMIGKVLGKRSLLSYLLTIIVGAMASGILIDYVFPANWFHQITLEAHAHHHSTSFEWWQIASGIILTLLIVNGYIQKRIKPQKSSGIEIDAETMDIKTLTVEGMSCNHCKANVETNLKKLPSVDDVEVNLAEKSVILKGEEIAMDEVKEMIHSLGYKA